MNKLKVRYQGWSGLLLEAPEAPGLPPLAFDPAPGRALPDLPHVVLITHGHPEHVKGAAAHISRQRKQGITVVGSPSVCRYLKGKSRNASDSFLEVDAGFSGAVSGWQVDVFPWDHMPLFPPEWNAKWAHLGRLLSHPLGAVRIALEGLAGPSHGPMLGYRISAPSLRFVYFGEGLHRRTSKECLEKAIGTEPVDALFAAVEPEDCHCLPELLPSGLVENFLAFEAHRPWRAEFGMPQADLKSLCARLERSGMSAQPLQEILP